jgi:hypothetical protein
MEIRRKSLAVLLGVAIAGIVGASAASLQLTSNGVGADTAIVAACDADGMNASYTTEYVVTAVALNGVDANCNGNPTQITLSTGGPTPTVLATVSGLASTGVSSFTLTTPISAKQLGNIAVVISG